MFASELTIKKKIVKENMKYIRTLLGDHIIKLYLRMFETKQEQKDFKGQNISNRSFESYALNLITLKQFDLRN